MADTHEPQNTLIIVYGLIASFLLVLCLLALLYYFDRVQFGQIRAKVELAPNTELRKQRVYEDEHLGLNNQYAYVNRAQGTVRIPIERAIDLEAQTSWRQNARLSGEVAAMQRNDGGTTHGVP